MIIGTGFQLVDFSVVTQALERQGQQFLDEIYSQGERSIASEADAIRFYTGRLAGKMAWRKAMGISSDHDVKWSECEVLRDTCGRPCINLMGSALRHLDSLCADGHRGFSHISLSHDGSHALAFVIVERLTVK